AATVPRTPTSELITRPYRFRKRPKTPSSDAWAGTLRLRRSINTTRMGTRVLESRYEAIIENPTANDSGRNIALAAPGMNSAGVNIARMQIMDSRRGPVVSVVG